ncbi:tyrosine-protein kinase receptor Tie-1-like [Amphiura filiformis]|uniref:tyrosine-protein kinase receptor Tie-1-like n=1 Tax=Amphiura filiformis TaxID=82378 RepID=UPI003B2230CB
MAIESILGDEHTTESDVWSFGVLLWEIVTLGSRPYPKLKGDAIRKLLKNGQRMPQPKHCSEQLYNIMLVCWEKEPSKRPSFEQLMKLLEEVLKGENGYLSFANFETKLYEDVSLPAPNEKV